MKKILGLDLGVGSVGWAAILCDDDHNPVEILGMGSRIVPLIAKEGDDFAAGKSESICAKRTVNRTARKGLDRYQMRRHQLKLRLGELGMADPEDPMLNLSPMEIWQLRADAATVGKQLTLPQIGRVLLHMNQKRGYKHAKSDMGEAKQTEYVAKVNQRYHTLHEKNMTAGQYFANELRKSETISENGKKSYTFRIKENVLPRQAYQEEFDSIMSAQKVFYPSVLTDENIADLKNIIFYQRPLKSCKHLVSHCEFMRLLFRDKHAQGKLAEGGPKVAPVSSPLAQVCRIYEAINNISLTNPFNKHRLDSKGTDSVLPGFEGKKPKDLRLMEYQYKFTPEERQKIFNELNSNAKLTGTQLLKLLGLTKKDGFKFDESIGKGIKGNSTLLALRSALEGVENAEELLKFDLSVIDLTKKETVEIDGKKISKEDPVYDKQTGEIVKTISPAFIKQPLYQLWHLVYSISDKTELAKAIAKKYGDRYPGITAPEVIDRLFAIDFVKEGYTNKSVKFMRLLLPSLIDGQKYSEAAEHVGINHSGSLTKEENEAREVTHHLENLQKGALRQPTVEKILNQMINVVNATVDKFGPMDEIRVELARSLKQSKEERDKTTKSISQSEKENEKIRTQITEHGLAPTRRNVQKFKLHKETGGRCIYCGQTVSLSEFLGGHGVEVEHIIPRSLFFDDSLSNKACACRKCNAEKGNRTAYDYMSTKPDSEFDAYIERVEKLTESKAISRIKHDRLLTAGKDIPNDFLNRDLRETQYISRKAREILKGICHDVNASSGSVTDFFRHAWGYDDVLHNVNFARYEQAGLTQEVEYESKGQTHREKRIADWTKRLDHRHHAVDALVVALTRQGYIQRLNNMNSQREDMHSELPSTVKTRGERFHLLEEWAASRPHFPVKEVEEAVDTVAVSYKAGKKVTTPGKRKVRKGGKSIVVQTGLNVPRGALHKDTIYGLIKLPDGKKPFKYALDNLDLVVSDELRQKLQKALEKNGHDKAKTLKQLKKEPPVVNGKPQTDAECFRQEVVVRYKVGSIEYKHLPSVIDEAAREAIKERYEEPEIARDSKKFQKSLEERPIMVGGRNKVPLKNVRCLTGNLLSKMVAVKKDSNGKTIGFAQSGNNHHVAFYQDVEGKVQTLVTTFWDCVKRRAAGLPFIITNPKQAWEIIDSLPENDETAYLAVGLPSPDWTFLQSLQMNEMFILGLSDEQLADATASNDIKTLSTHLYRVQKLAMGNYNFRLHTSTNVSTEKCELLLNKWKLITSYKAFTSLNPRKVRVNLLGDILID